MTKLFIKDAARFALEATLNKHRTVMATVMQTNMRAKLARTKAKNRRDAREVI